MSRKLYRSNSNRMLGGVCAGLADYLSLDATLVRVLYILISVLSAAFPGVLVYIILWAVMPPEY